MNIYKRYILLFLIIKFSIFYQVTGQEINIALNKSVAASAPTRQNPPIYITDGNSGTACFPVAETGNKGFYFEIDLEDEYPLDRIIIRNSASCCPDRLSNYRVVVYRDYHGVIGEESWSADIRSDGSNSGLNGADTLIPSQDIEGRFYGQYIRIIALDDISNSPQLAEIEVYQSHLPEIKYFGVDFGNITQSANPSLPDSAKLSWMVQGADSIIIDQAIGLVEANDSIIVAPDVKTNYQLTAYNQWGLTESSVTIGVDTQELFPQLTEFMAKNSSTLEDEDDDRPDWIEIYNPNNFTINLGGYYLTDIPDTLNKWQFPEKCIEPNSFLIVYASDKNKNDKLGELHANFKLSNDGDYIALVNRDGVSIIQQFPADYPASLTYPKQESDVSYGLNSMGEFVYFSPASPSLINTNGYDGFVDSPFFSHKRGFYENSISVTIESTTPEAIIRFTLDGTEPTELNGQTYQEAISISKTTVLRTRVFKEGLRTTEIDTRTFIFPEDVIASEVMNKRITQDARYTPVLKYALLDLPTISLVTSSEINNTTKVRTSIEWLNPDGIPGFQEYAGIQYYGGAWTEFDKRNFRISFQGVFGTPKLEYPVFSGHDKNIPAVTVFDQLELRAGSHDMVKRGFYMSNRYTDDTMLEMGNLNPHGRFVHVYIDGVYWGQYHLRERWNASMFSEYFGGKKSDYEAINGNLNLGGWALIENAYDGEGLAWEHAKSFRSDYEAIKTYLDVPAYIDFMLLFFYGNAESEYRTVGSVNNTVGFQFYLNDADGFTRDAGNRTGSRKPGQMDGDGPGSIFSMLHEEGHPEYMTLLADRIYAHFFNDGALTPSKMQSRLEERCNQVEKSIVAECARWEYQTPDTWTEDKQEYISNVLPLRTYTVINQLIGAGLYPGVSAPEFSHNGGLVPSGFQLRLFADASEIYYTKDGTDPRISGGGISESARKYIPMSDTKTTKLVHQDSKVFARIPFDESLADSWTSVDYIESEEWLKNESGAGVGYDRNSEFESHIDLSVETQMFDINTSVYIRYPFEIISPSDIVSLSLSLKYDDGYIAYLNGEQIASANANTNPGWNSVAAANHPDDQAVLFEKAVITHSDVVKLLHKGKNVLAIHGLNREVTSTDMLIEAKLDAVENFAQGEEELVIISSASTIKARAYSDGVWSALAEAKFEIEAPSYTSHSDELFREGYLSQNFPNPFSNETQITYRIKEGDRASFTVFDVTGRIITEKILPLSDGEENLLKLETEHWTSGVYFYQLKNENGVVSTGQMIKQ